MPLVGTEVFERARAHDAGDFRAPLDSTSVVLRGRQVADSERLARRDQAFEAPGRRAAERGAQARSLSPSGNK